MNQQSKDTGRVNAIVYLHRRKSDGEVFYVGIGSKRTRAYDSKQRSRFWKAYTVKYPYSVEVLYEGLTWQEACGKERELIKQYGRRDLGGGTLVNMTDGGDGATGRKDSLSRIKQKSTYLKANNPMLRPEYREKVSISKKDKQRFDMKGDKNPNFKEGVKEVKQESFKKFLLSKRGTKYRENLKESYKKSLGSDESKRKSKEANIKRLQALTQEEKQALTKNMNKCNHKCQHCGVITNSGNFKRWHGNNCKKIKI